MDVHSDWKCKAPVFAIKKAATSFFYVVLTRREWTDMFRRRNHTPDLSCNFPMTFERKTNKTEHNSRSDGRGRGRGGGAGGAASSAGESLLGTAAGCNSLTHTQHSNVRRNLFRREKGQQQRPCNDPFTPPPPLPPSLPAFVWCIDIKQTSLIWASHVSSCAVSDGGRKVEIRQKNEREADKGRKKHPERCWALGHTCVIHFVATWGQCEQDVNTKPNILMKKWK